MRLTLLILLTWVPCVLADDWEDFTNNLATDLAPLITLFGERLTQQFLSESIHLVDNVIFALSPLGVLTTVVSVIRVCGSSSLRAFIGRAQEGPAEAESELLSCVSESTAELFNDGGISRVFGRPKVLEVVAWEDETRTEGERPMKFGTLIDAIEDKAWSLSDDQQRLPNVDIPNLSLNKGIKRVNQRWFYCVAVIGAALQAGVVTYAIITVFVLPNSFKKDGEAVPIYAFPCYIIGTTFLFIGMFCSAIIIERSSRKYCLKPKKPSKLYWLQPGNQKVGDQVFSAFLAEDSAPKEYIKSVRDRGFDGQTSKIYLTVFFTVIGFIMQFIGLRGLHASVILASLGATLVMSILRTCLRTERMGPKENKLKDDREMTAYKQQELDCFAFQLAEENESVGLVSFSLHDILPDDSSPDQGTDHDNSMVKRLIQARVRLAELATTSDDGSTVPWDNMPIRSVAHKLSRTIETTMDLMSGWGAEFGESFAFPLALECEIKAGTPSQATYPVHLSRGGDSLRWRMNPNELEAVLGLWTWSLYRLEQDWRLPLYRLIGMDNVEAGKEATYLYFHKWIFRQTEARMVNLKMIDSSRRLFGFDADNFAYDSDILVMETENELDVMAAQDIYVHFIKIAFQHLTELGGDVDVSVGLIGDYVAENSRISDLVGCFENCQMGSREDALLCIVPALKDRGLIPSLAADSANIRARTDRLIRENAWVKAFHLVEWICQRSSGIDFDYSIFELGYLCRRALLSNVKAAQLEGFSYTCKILGSDTRKIFLQTPKTSLSSLWPQSPEDISSWHSFCKQIGWVAWRISKSIHGMEWIQDDLEKLNAHQDTGFSDATAGYKEQAVVGMQAMQQLLTFNPIDPRNSQPNPQDALGYWWAQGQGFNALLYFALSRWVELAAENQNQNFIQHAFTVTANCRSGYGIEILQRRGADIDALNTDKTSALMQVVDQQDTEGVQTLLEHGANPNGHDRVLQRRPLVLAAQRGCTAIVKLLLHHGARHEAFDSFGWSALYCAVSENHLETARVLLSYGADANKGSDGSTPLRSAVAANQIEMVELLTEHGADVNLSAGIGTSTVLMRAAELSHTDMVRLLLAKGANIHAKDSDGLTALDRARRENCEETVAILETAS